MRTVRVPLPNFPHEFKKNNLLKIGINLNNDVQNTTKWHIFIHCYHKITYKPINHLNYYVLTYANTIPFLSCEEKFSEESFYPYDMQG